MTMNEPAGKLFLQSITLRQLQILETVVRLGGFTRAAEALHLTQPTVSMQIRKLTDTIGLPLLEQVGGRVHPTDAGREVYRAAVDVLGRMAALRDYADAARGVVQGDLRLGVISSAIYFMPALLGAFAERHARVVPQLVVTNRATVLRRLRENLDDLLIMGQAPREMPVEAYPFIGNRIVVVAPPGHALAAERAIPLVRLAEEKFLVREPGSGTRQAAERLFADAGVTIRPWMELGSAEAIKQGVMAGLGVSVLSRRNIVQELAAGSVVELDVQGFPIERQWYAVHPRGKELSLAARSFLDFILTESDRILAGPAASTGAVGHMPAETGAADDGCASVVASADPAGRPG